MQRRPVPVSFVLERHLGLGTFADNLRACADELTGITPTWHDVTYAPQQAWWERIPLPGTRVRDALRGRAEVRRTLDDGAAVRFFNTQVPAVLGGSAVLRRVPYVLCTDVTPVQYDRMAEGYGHAVDPDGALAWAKHRANVRAFRDAAAVVGWSDWVRRSVVEDYGVPTERVEVIAPGVDTTAWHPDGHAAERPVRILFVGGDLWRKGGEALLAAFAGLPPGSAELVLVTRTPYPGGPGIRVERGQRPNTPALRALYRSSDVFVLPSRAETFGLAAVEAAASGLPVVATRVGGLPDIVDDGRTGFLLEPGDVDALRHRLEALALDPLRRRAMGVAARRRAEQLFGVRRNARRLAAVLHRAAGVPLPVAERAATAA